MKLYMVLYFAGQIAGSVGPLPYDEAECERRAAELRSDCRPGVVTPQGLTCETVTFKCERLPAHPKATWRLNKP